MSEKNTPACCYTTHGHGLEKCGTEEQIWDQVEQGLHRARGRSWAGRSHNKAALPGSRHLLLISVFVFPIGAGGSSAVARGSGERGVEAAMRERARPRASITPARLAPPPLPGSTGRAHCPEPVGQNAREFCVPVLLPRFWPVEHKEQLARAGAGPRRRGKREPAPRRSASLSAIITVTRQQREKLSQGGEPPFSRRLRFYENGTNFPDMKGIECCTCVRFFPWF
ncbi:hypothetical protein AAFF_G00121040 [Aldrovandia affinis]|uniref:Uncharacterized protein n=1 Tax=Aldrovandia affinis TaxID=143900 RepID=A0AAD7WA03_9TELE|nr:hypothetical protein AAFF_G00121040 [Aldrovandia affinis]